MPVILALWEALAGGSPELRSSRPAWATWWNPISTKIPKINRVWQHAPVIPATQEAEAGELLEPGRRRLQWAEIVLLHSSAWARVRLCLSKKKKRNWVLKRWVCSHSLGNLKFCWKTVWDPFILDIISVPWLGPSFSWEYAYRSVYFHGFWLIPLELLYFFVSSFVASEKVFGKYCPP